MKKYLFLAIFAVSLAAGQAQSPAPGIPREASNTVREILRDFDTKNYDAALQKLQTLDPAVQENPFVINLFGSAYTKKRDFAKANEYFDKAIQKDPGYFPSQFNIGEVLYLQKNYAEATQHFRKMLQNDPRNELLQFKLFLCFLMQGDQDSAKKVLDRIRFPGDTPAWYYAQAAWEFKVQNNVQQARYYISAAREIFGPKAMLFEESLADSDIKP